MATILKRPESKYWIASFNAVDGRRLKRSTKETDRKLAQKIADGFEEVARRKRTVAQSRRVLSEIHKAVTGGTTHHHDCAAAFRPVARGEKE